MQRAVAAPANEQLGLLRVRDRVALLKDRLDLIEGGADGQRRLNTARRPRAGL
jgi:hypothetical protein